MPFVRMVQKLMKDSNSPVYVQQTYQVNHCCRKMMPLFVLIQVQCRGIARAELFLYAPWKNLENLCLELLHFQNRGYSERKELDSQKEQMSFKSRPYVMKQNILCKKKKVFLEILQTLIFFGPTQTFLRHAEIFFYQFYAYLYKKKKGEILKFPYLQSTDPYQFLDVSGNKTFILFWVYGNAILSLFIVNNFS